MPLHPLASGRWVHCLQSPDQGKKTLVKCARWAHVYMKDPSAAERRGTAQSKLCRTMHTLKLISRLCVHVSMYCDWQFQPGFLISESSLHVQRNKSSEGNSVIQRMNGGGKREGNKRKVGVGKESGGWKEEEKMCFYLYCFVQTLWVQYHVESKKAQQPWSGAGPE